MFIKPNSPLTELSVKICSATRRLLAWIDDCAPVVWFGWMWWIGRFGSIEDLRAADLYMGPYDDPAHPEHGRYLLGWPAGGSAPGSCETESSARPIELAATG